ncbi:MAG: hypothetical protein IT376_14470 [Polyangiaceae bacterium]|nr:hypothetical protein [Polyangiaceae bacterium]
MHRRSSARGISRVEALAVGGAVLVAGLFGARLVVSSPGDAAARAHDDAATVALAASTWRAEHPGECPTLGVLERDGALPKGARAHDPWGGRFRVACSSSGVSVISAGPDGKAGTGDDLREPPQ